ncbi:histidine phosphatase family protein [Dongia deserti]|uniref:histidine phosphatase family protein n=1 Tax=Dongia deserti TaxID=2268030 RepID=UPI0013C4C761|nr:histidine phosphatase family protein [Dongia deserti]
MIARIAIALIIVAAVSHNARADEAAAWKALRTGGHIALMRHTSAPGAGDPPDFTLGDCTTQRNLSAKGREDAAAIGARIKAEGVAFEKILSSPWCRCVDTARLMELGPVETESTFSNAFVLSNQGEALAAGAKALIQAWKGPGNLLVVTHGANIQPLTGISPAQGEIVVIEVGADASIEPVGSIPPPG